MERTSDRRRVLVAGGAPRDEAAAEHCISSAVVTVQPARQREVLALAYFAERPEIETVGVVFFDLEGGIIRANNAFCRMTGFEESELLGQVPPPSLHAFETIWNTRMVLPNSV